MKTGEAGRKLGNPAIPQHSSQQSREGAERLAAAVGWYGPGVNRSDPSLRRASLTTVAGGDNSQPSKLEPADGALTLSGIANQT